ncbi:flagellin [Mediterraneibacter gnavus]|uniref:Flagellin n=4 Tax=Mediterraneibacter gnavus TaxID=33038 RepID=A0AAJ1B0E5_MEDGN|nr:flagellin [Mediterraneibacter gnavus]MCB5494626.1 flagellin [Mediterraneibacter gnavus]MCB5593808.1 flagellin [Mediterraneibacter gnavus]MCB5606519.1 flagellin [Mediterraneibacter gnavus]
MRIQHNIAALNSYRNLTGNNSAVSKNLEKLSSGYRINRAGDDAAGLAISEKMRAQITGLNTAQKNAQDGVSLVQTAEGAMTEVHSMLNRMVELADQSANGTYADEVDRENLQKEISSLKDEIDRIADSTNFNGINLLDGSLSTGKLPTFTGLDGLTPTTIAATGNKTELTIGKVAADVDTGKEYSLTFNYTDANGAAKEKTIKLTAKNNQTLVDANGNDYALKTPGQATEEEMAKAFAGALSADSEVGGQFTVTANAGKLSFVSKETGSTGGSKVLAATTKYDTTSATLTAAQTAGTDAKVEYDFTNMEKDKVFTVNGEKFVFATAGKQFDSDVNVLETTGTNPTADEVGKMAGMIANKLGLSDEQVKDDGTKITFSASAGNGGLTLQIGDTADSFNQMTVSVGDMHAKALGISDIDISTQAGAKAAVDKIKSAINSVSSTRGDLGAIQNRLEHTINNLSVSSENMTAAESRIRDVDMANEMMAYTKNNILVQSSQAMLAQANQLPQGVLQLLQ